MNKIQMHRVTKRIYEEYGFVKKGKYFYLDLSDVLICSGFVHRYSHIYLSYNFSIKAIHSMDEIKKDDMFSGFDSRDNAIYLDESAEGYEKKAIFYEKYDELEYEKILRTKLHYYFDPYKTDAFGHLIKINTIVGFVHKKEIIPIKINAKQYLGINID